MTAADTPATGASRTVRVAVVLARLAAAAVLLGGLGVAAAAPEVPLLLKATCTAILGVTLVWPAAGVLSVLALAPAGLLFAPQPANAAEAMAWSFLAGWLASVWRPLGRQDGTFATRSVAYYGAAVAASWLGLVLADSGGIPPAHLPGYLLRTIVPDHLVFSSPEAETWSAIHVLTGLALFGAAVSLSRDDERLPRWAAAALVVSSGLLGLATLAGVWREWAAQQYGGWFLWRYVTGVRYSLHLPDLNAAGSLFVMAGLAAVSLAANRLLRRGAILAGLAMVPALLLSGSRSAVAGAVAAGVIVLVRGPGRGGNARAGARVMLPVAAVLLVLLGGIVVTSALTSDPTGGAGASLGLRSEFAATSARMIASAPAFGVGIGRYYPRSPEFMSPHLRSIYPYENAHNYLLQQFSELGVVGGGLFVLMLTSLLAGIWRSLAARPAPATLALLTGVVAYLATCLTGHPLLVSEAAFPFWIALGAAAAAIPRAADAPQAWHRWMPRAVPAVLLLSLGVSTVRANAVFPAPPDRGFHDEQQTPEGLKYRWTTRHAVAWVQPDVGFLTIDVQAPVLPGRTRPFVVRLEADGALVQTATIPAGRWTQVGVALSSRGRQPRRRIDLRVNQVWSEKRDRPGPNVTDDRPRGIMAGYPLLHAGDLVNQHPGGR